MHFLIFGHFPDAGDGGGGDVPRTLPSGQTPRPSRAGSKYPVQGIPHFDKKNTVGPQGGIEVMELYVFSRGWIVFIKNHMILDHNFENI